MNRALMIVTATGAAFGFPPVTMLAVDVAQAADATEIQISEKAPLGKFLTDAKGVSLYLFEADSKATSTCYETCAQAWPPLLTDGTPVADDQLDAGMLSTTKRKDGSTQVTYNGWPLYYFAKDQAAGDTQGQDVEDFGAEWYLISPEGEKVHD